MAEKTFKLKKKKKNKKPRKPKWEKPPGHRAAFTGEFPDEPRCPENNPLCQCLYPRFEN